MKRQIKSDGCLILLLLSLVPTCPKNLPMSGILTTSVNTPSQTSQTVGDFYDVIGRIGSISTLKVLSQTSAIFTMSVNMKFACLGHRECLILSLLATKA